MRRERSNDSLINNDNDNDDQKSNKKLKVNDIDEMIKDAIIDLVNKRGPMKTCWPSEIPRVYLKLTNWRDFLKLTRDISLQLAADGIIAISQKNIVLEKEQLSTCKGPIRLRKINIIWMIFYLKIDKNCKDPPYQ